MAIKWQLAVRFQPMSHQLTPDWPHENRFSFLHCLLMFWSILQFYQSWIHLGAVFSLSLSLPLSLPLLLSPSLAWEPDSVFQAFLLGSAYQFTQLLLSLSHVPSEFVCWAEEPETTLLQSIMMWQTASSSSALITALRRLGAVKNNL